MYCEHRHMCVDSRTPLKGKCFYFFKHECKYNPYIAKWQGEEGYITVEEWREKNPDWQKNLVKHD